MMTPITTGTARPRDSISTAIKDAAASGRPAVVGFMTAGFPDRAHFTQNLRAIVTEADFETCARQQFGNIIAHRCGHQDLLGGGH